MQAKHRVNVVEIFAGLGYLVAQGLEALNGSPRGADSPPGVRVFGNATMAQRVPRQTLHGFANNAPRSVAKRGIVLALVGFNKCIEGNHAQSKFIDLRMKCQASS